MPGCDLRSVTWSSEEVRVWLCLIDVGVSVTRLGDSGTGEKSCLWSYQRKPGVELSPAASIRTEKVQKRKL